LKKLFAIVIGIMVILSLTLAIPAMAGIYLPVTSPNNPHFDVNFVTGVDPLAYPVYQIQVPKKGTTDIDLASGGGFLVSDPPKITLLAGETYEVWAQIRSKPGTSASIQLPEWPAYNFTAPKMITDPWKFIGVVTVPSETGLFDSITFINDITYDGKINGSSNFATRWVPIPH
jgi:hypothetical protein